MPQPAKPYSILKAEKKSHRTKAELAQRKQAESALLSGESIKESVEVQNDVRAHNEFIRICGLLENIEKNDAIYEQSINRYCLLISEETDLQVQIEVCKQNLEELNDDKASFDDLQLFYKLRTEMLGVLIKLDRQLQEKRKMLLSLEKENAMTIASALRTIPKKPEEKKNALMEVLGGM